MKNMKKALFYSKFYLLLMASPLWSDGAKDFVETTFPKGHEAIAKDSLDTEDFVEDGKFAHVYYIKKEGQTVAVLKEFGKTPSSIKDYKKELKALERLKKLHSLPFSEMLLSGEDNNYYYIVMECASGKSLNLWLKEISKAGFMRPVYFKNFLRGIKRTGEELKKFHLTYKETSLELSPKKEEYDRSRFDYFYQRWEKEPIPGIHIRRLQEKEENLRPLVRHATIGQVHGDLHIGNIFFDSKKDMVTFIDFSTLNYPNETKTGLPLSLDVMKLLTSLKVLAKTYGLSDKEIRQIEKAFFDGYGKDMISESEIEYYTILETLNLIECYDKQKELLPLYQHTINLLKDTLTA